MTMTEMNAIRNAVRAPFVEKIVEAFPEAVNLMGTNDYVIPTVTPDDEPCCVKISISVPTWFDTEKRKGWKMLSQRRRKNLSRQKLARQRML